MKMFGQRGIRFGDRLAAQPLRRLIDSIAAIQIIITLVLVATISFAGFTMNKSAANSEMALIDNALSQSVARVASEQKSAAKWHDASRANMRAQSSSKWTNAEIGNYLFTNYGHQIAFVIDAKNEPVAAFAYGKEAPIASFEVYRASLAPLVKDIRNHTNNRYLPIDGKYLKPHQRYEFLQGEKSSRWAGNFLSIGDKPVIASALSIPSPAAETRDASMPYVLVSIVHVDQSMLSDIGEALLLDDLTISPAAEPSSAPNQRAFVTDDGKTVAKLSWTAAKPGQLMLTLVLPLVIIAAFAAGSTTRSLFRRLKLASNNLADREAKAIHQALHDPLSGLPNRRSFVKTMESVLAQCRTVQTRLAVAYVDIDHFKDVNDTLGHRMGDKLISAVGTRLKSAMRPGDILARFGGDEFAALRLLEPAENGATFGKDLNRAFALPIDMFEQSLRVTGSIGITVVDDYNLTISDIMRHADIALYRAKDEGRACYALFTNEMAQSIEDRRVIETDLQKAIQLGSLTMVYQPLIDCVSNKIKGVEALVRWSHPVRGPISPGVFIPIAESTGLMPALGEWVLDQVFADARKWPNLEVAVNLSPAQIRHLNLVPELRKLLRKHSVDAGRIVLEITEGVLLEQTETTAATLAEIRELGFKFALDDFGTGYSSLSYLRQFHFDKIKIDQSFVHGATEASQAIKIVHAVTELGKSLNMSVVAEGIENEYEAELMINAGCNELQGYYFSRPVQGAAIDAFFAVPAAEIDLDVRKMLRA